MKCSPLRDLRALAVFANGLPGSGQPRVHRAHRVIVHFVTAFVRRARRNEMAQGHVAVRKPRTIEIFTLPQLNLTSEWKHKSDKSFLGTYQRTWALRGASSCQVVAVLREPDTVLHRAHRVIVSIAKAAGTVRSRRFAVFAISWREPCRVEFAECHSETPRSQGVGAVT